MTSKHKARCKEYFQSVPEMLFIFVERSPSPTRNANRGVRIPRVIGTSLAFVGQDEWRCAFSVFSFNQSRTFLGTIQSAHKQQPNPTATIANQKAMDLTKGVVVRRWNSVPLDPTPQPPPYLVVTETPDAEEDANNNTIEKADNTTEYEEEEGGDKPVQPTSTPDTASSEEVTSPQGGTDGEPSKMGSRLGSRHCPRL